MIPGVDTHDPLPPLSLRWTRGPKILQIAMTVVMALAITVGFVNVIRAGNPVTGHLAIALTALGVALIWSRPYAALGLVTAGTLTAAVFGWDPIVQWSVACFAALVLTLRGLPGLLTGVVIALSNLAAAGLVEGTISPSENPAASIAGFAALSASAAGSAIRGHRRYLVELEGRTREAIVTRQAAVDRGVAEERVRIARDLHDSVGHQIAVVSMHLGAAEVHLPSGADAARADLVAARTSIQAVLQETQQILQVLRVGAEPRSVAPTPDHRRITELLDTFRSAGMTIEASMSDLPREMRPNVSAAVFRIVQETLTNAQRHGTGEASLSIRLTDQASISIEVVNVRHPESDVPQPGAGQGLVGMRERAASVGGHLVVQSDDRLFWVHVDVPLEGEPT